MTLDLCTDDLGPYLHGTADVRHDDGGWLPRRLDAARAALLVKDPVWKRCGASTAGITLRLHSDAAQIDLAVTVGGDQAPKFALDVEVDGRWSHRVVEADCGGAWHNTVHTSDDGALHEIILHLPFHVTTTITSLELKGATFCEPLPQRPLRYLALGDSITQGHSAVHPSGTWVARLARLLGAELWNFGVAGHNFDPAWCLPALPCTPDLVTVAYGVNDWACDRLTATGHARRIAAFCTNLRAAVPRSTRIVVISPLWWTQAGQQHCGSDLASFGTMLREVAGAEIPEALLVDGFALLPQEPWYLADGLHPNDHGFGQIAAELARRLA